MKISISPLIAFALVTAVAAGPGENHAQTARATPPTTAFCSVNWAGNEPVEYDRGEAPSAAVDTAGSILELHGGVDNGKVSYRTGQLQNNSISFNNSIFLTNGYYPSISMNTDDVAVEVHADRPHWLVNSQMFIRLGKLHPGQQSVDWQGFESKFYDGGYYPQVAVNDSGWIVEVHETNRVGSHDLLYRLGKIYPGFGGEYLMYWATGSNGVKYDEGRYPHVTLDNAGNVIEVHQASASNNLHYRRGTITNVNINFANAASNGRYQTGNSAKPVIATSQTGFVQEIHSLPNSGVERSQIGQVNGNSNNVVDWKDAVSFGNGIEYGLSTNGNRLVYVDRASSGTPNRLRYRVGSVNCP